ncbi:MAG TPA: hypothetical protein VGI92_14315 [Gemmatimonadales bacterium]|jgi:hypothetical protein
MRRVAVMVVIAAALAARAEAQEYLDRGTLVIARGGSETGRVEFAVRATSGQGQGGLLVVGTTRTPAHEVQYILEVTRELTPVTYQLSETTGGHVVRRVSAQVVGMRFSARASTEAGDVARELPVRPPFVIMGSDDFTFYFFLPRPEPGASRVVNVVRTENLTLTTGTVTNLADDTVLIAGHPIDCRKYELKLADGDTRQFCMTPTGGLVQVVIASSGITATLSQPPSR